MPLRPETAPTGGFLPNRDLSTPVPEDEGLSTAAKVTGAAGLGAGMLFAPALTLGAMATVGGGALLADGEGASAAFRMENTVGSLLSSNSLAFDGPAEDGYDPWADIAGTPYEEHWENFTRARSKAHADAIKSDIDREVKDRKYLESQGAVGFAQGLAAGLFDPTILLPGGAVVRSARGGASVLRSAASVAAYGAAGAVATEGALQATQQTRTGEESAMAIAGATVLSGLLGAGLARRALASGFDMDGVGKAIEDDLGRGPDDSAASPAFTPRPDDLSPAGAAALAGSVPARDPDLDADIATARDTTDALRTELETVASRILPDSVKLNVVESLRADADKVKSGAEQLGIRAYHGTGADFDRFDMAHVGEGEGTRRAGYGLYFADNAANATRYREFTAPTVIGDEVVATGEVRQAAMLRREGKLDQVLGQERRDVQALLDKPNPSDFMVEATNRKLGRVEAMERVAKGEVRSGGHLYEVELDAEPTQLLDWDVPVKDQPEVAAKAREAARKAGLGEEAMDLKGSDFYAALEAKTMSDVATSRLLAESGVPGVRYWNAETTDYVAFDDSLVKITAKDGKPVAAGERAKVVDELFSIRRGVHGTDRGFKVFDESKFAPSEWGHGVYMFPEEWVKAQGAAGKTVGYGHGSGAMRNLILQVETSRPFVIDATEFGKSSADWAALKEHGWTFEGSPGEYWDRGVVGRDAQIRAAKRFSEALLKAGYDSVIVRRDGVDREIVGIRQGSVKYANSGETAFAVRRGEQPQTPDTPRTPTEVKGYHGTPNGAIERFRAEHASEAHDGAFFFTSRPEGTARYTGEAFFDSPFDMNMKPAVYPVYVETKGFKEIDWAGQTHNDGTGPSGGSLNDEMAIAKREGAPGLVVRNIDEGNGEENWYISWGDNTVRSALSESQMLGMRKGTGGDPTVEGSFSRDAQGNLMVTISRAALDPVGTLHHESVHALKELGTFTPREWKALENAAKSKGWMTVPEMADYAKLYGPSITGETAAPPSVKPSSEGGQAQGKQLVVARPGVPQVRNVADFKNAVDELKAKLNVTTRPRRELPDSEKFSLRSLVTMVEEMKEGSRLGLVADHVRGFKHDTQAIIDIAEQHVNIDFKQISPEDKEAFLDALSDLQQIVNDRLQVGYRVADEIDEVDELVSNRFEQAIDQMSNLKDDADSILEDMESHVEDLENIIALREEAGDTTAIDRSAREDDGDVDVAQIDASASQIIARYSMPDYANTKSILDVGELETARLRGIIDDVRAKFDALKDADTVGKRAVELEDQQADLGEAVYPAKLARDQADQLETILLDKRDEASKEFSRIKEDLVDPDLRRMEDLVDELEARIDDVGGYGQAGPDVRLSVRSKGGEAKPFDISKLSPDLQSRLTEEAIAMAYQRWVRGTEPHKGVIGAAFARVRNFLEAVRNALTGKGMNSAEDIFAKIDAGKIAERADGRKRAAMAKAPRQGASSVGAAASQTGDYRLKSTGIGLEKGLARLAPGLWLQNASSRIARQVADELQESGVYRADHADWFETARGGAEQGQYGAVESRIKTFQGQMLADGFTAIDDAFMKYRKGTDKRRTGDLTVTSLSDYFTGSGDKLDFKQFREAVGRAMAEGDSHEIAEVAALAKRLRPHFDKWKDEAIKLGLLPEGVTPETAPTYMMRLYDRKKIIDNRPEFKKVIVQWLGEVEKSNARVRDALRASMDELTSVEGEIAAAETRIQKRAERQAKADKKAREEGRVSTTDEAAVLKDEADQLAIQTAKVRLKEIEKLVQEQVEAYQGKTAGEAQSAIEARRKADEARDPSAKRRPEQMLKPVRDAAEKIAGQEPKDPAELPGLADQIISRIIGTPEGRLPYDAPSVKQQAFGADMDARGPLAARSWLIPDKLIEPFLERDIDMLLRSYAHTMISDIELAKRFGTPDMITKFKDIDEDYSALLNAAKTDAERRKLQREKDETFRNVAAIRDRLRGQYKIPEDPEAVMLRVGRTALTLSYMSKLGGMTVSAFTDPARFVMVHGLARTFSDGLIPMFANFGQFKKTARELERLHGVAEMITDSRALRMADISDTWGQNTKFERLVQSGGRQFGMVSLMAPWNATMKQFASIMTLNRIMRNAVKRAEGKTLSKGEQEYMAFLGISDGAARRMGIEFKQHGVKKNGLWLPNAENWAPEAGNVRDALSVALRKDIDRTIVTPSVGEKPKFASTMTGALMLQFKSFAFSATQKMLIAGLQQRDAAAVNGALLSMVLGGLVYYLKGEMAGKPALIPTSIDDTNWGVFMGEAFDRSGLAGILMEGNNLVEKVSRGKVGLAALTGKPISRYASRNTLQSLAGPTFGLAEDALDIAGSVFDDRQWTRKDNHRIRQVIPGQNIFYLRKPIDQIEAGLNEALGIPERASR